LALGSLPTNRPVLQSVVWWTALACFIGGTIWNWTRQPRVTKLQQQVTRLESKVDRYEHDYFEHFRNTLILLSKELEFGDTERISVYKHEGRAFVMLGRYSKNPLFDQSGRGIYPDSEGCIGRAWTSSESTVSNLPDPETNLAAYIAEVQKWNLSESTIRSLRMKSRSYAAFAIDDSKGARRIAVVVFESVLPEGLRIADLRTAMPAQGKRLAQFIEAMRDMEPTPTFATGEGF
jgi:hypothetical protein